MISNILRWIAPAGLALTAFVLGIKQLTEPDLWWQLRTGEYILEHGYVPKQDVFSYTFQGVSWINVKWGYEALIALWSRLAGPEGILLLQSLANLLLLWFLYRCYRLLRERNTGSIPSLHSLGFIFAAWVLLLGMAYRMNGRPEMVSHVMTLVYIGFFLRYRFRPGRFIYWLVPLQVLWANLHEGYGTGMVIAGVMTGAAWVEYRFLKKYTDISGRKFLYPLTIAAVLCLLAPALHPSGLQMIWHPYEIFSQVQENKFTTEMEGFASHVYWKKEAFVSIGVFVVCLIGFFLPYPLTPRSGNKRKFPWYMRPVYGFGAGYFLLFFLFFYLSLTAYRNIAMFLLVSAPLLAIVSYQLGKRIAATARLRTLVAGGAAAFGVLAYYLVVSNTFYKKWDEAGSRYGLRVNEYINPTGAAQFIEKNEIGGNNFSDFLVSNYLLWKLQPDFKTFIDLRDLDIFPAGFFNNFGYLGFQPEAVMELDSQYHFNYAVLTRGNFQALHRYFANSPDWAAVYADPVAAVYLRRNEQNRRLTDSIAMLDRITIFHEPVPVKRGNAARWITKIFNPAADVSAPPDIYASAELVASGYFLSAGWYREAKRSARAALRTGGNYPEAYALIGNAYLEQAMGDSISQRRVQYLDSANSAFEMGLAKDRFHAKCLVGLGSVSLSRQDIGSAASFLKKAVKSDPSLINAWLMLAEIQNYKLNTATFNKDKIVKERISYLRKAERLDENDVMIKFYIALAYGQLGECGKAQAYFEQAPEYPGMPEEERQYAATIKAQCGY